MCWSFQVSALFACFEALSMGVIILRARRSTHPYVRGQLWVLPLLSSILLVEICEAFIWLDPNLMSVTSKALREAYTNCTPYNSFLTLLFWIFVFPTQPLLVILPCRRMPGNRELLKIPEYLAIAYMVYFWLVMVMHKQHLIWNTADYMAPRYDLQHHGYQLFTNVETCTYRGRFGHLFWTWDQTESWTTPNGSCYLILVQAVFYTCRQTWRFLGWCVLLNGFIVVGLCVYLHGSVEVASVWCWTGVTFHIYLLLQPYVLPCRMEVIEEDVAVVDEVEVVALTAPSSSASMLQLEKDQAF